MTRRSTGRWLALVEAVAVLPGCRAGGADDSVPPIPVPTRKIY